MGTSLEARVAQLEAESRLARDKQEIYRALMLYCRGIDRCVPEVVTRVWPIQDLEVTTGIVKWLRENTQAAMHYVGNCVIDVDGDEAESEAYMIAYHIYEVDGTDKLRLKAGRDLRTWQRTDDGWVTTGREYLDEWSWFVEVAERAPGADGWTYGERGPQDPAFDIRGTIDRMKAEGRRLPTAGYPGLPQWKL